MRVSHHTQRVQKRLLNEVARIYVVRITQVHCWCSPPFQVPLSSRGRGAGVNLGCTDRSSIGEDIDYRIRNAEPALDWSWHADVVHQGVVVEVLSPGSLMIDDR